MAKGGRGKGKLPAAPRGRPVAVPPRVGKTPTVGGGKAGRRGGKLPPKPGTGK